MTENRKNNWHIEDGKKAVEIEQTYEAFSHEYNADARKLKKSDELLRTLRVINFEQYTRAFKLVLFYRRTNPEMVAYWAAQRNKCDERWKEFCMQEIQEIVRRNS